MLELNNLSSSSYKMVMSRTPTLEYRVQQVTLPGVALGTADVPTPFTKIPLAGNIEYDELQVTFKVGENLTDWLEVYRWMEGLGQPKQLGSFPPRYDDAVTDINITVLNNSSNGILDFKFVDAYPIRLSGIPFDIAVADVRYLTATAVFRYLRYEVNSVA